MDTRLMETRLMGDTTLTVTAGARCGHSPTHQLRSATWLVIVTIKMDTAFRETLDWSTYCRRDQRRQSGARGHQLS